MSDLRYLTSMNSAACVADCLDSWLRRSRDEKRTVELELERALIQGASPVHVWGSWAAWLCGHPPASEKYEEGGHAFMRQAAEMFSVAVRRAVEAKR